MPRELKETDKFHISYSEYRSFTQCPFKQLLSKVFLIEEPKKEVLIYGSTVHNSIEYILRNDITDKNTWDEVVKNELTSEVNESYAQGYFGERLQKQAMQSLKALDVFTRYDGYEIVDIEELLYEPLAQDVVPIYFKAYLDLILIKKGRILIIDWKTANAPWDINKKEKDKAFYGQLALYQHFYSKKHNIPIQDIDVSFVTLPRNNPTKIQTFDVEITDDYRNFIVEDVMRVAREILNLNPLNVSKAKTQVGTHGFPCNWCSYNQDKNSKGICNDKEKQVITLNDG